MRILVLVILAIVAYLLYKKFIAKPGSDSPALEDAADSASRTVREIGDGATEAAAGAAAAGKAAVEEKASAAVATAAGVASVASDAAANLVPDSGNPIDDIQEMLKILNLRSSDASRLDITAEQFENLKSGQAGDLSGELVEKIASRLREMI